MDIVVSVVITALVLGSLIWVLARTQVPSYRPTRESVAELLRKVIHGEAAPEQWDMFIGYPILHDPDLELIRRQCIVISEGDEENRGYPSGLGDNIFNRAGREKIAEVLEEMQELIEEEPFKKDF